VHVAAIAGVALSGCADDANDGALTGGESVAPTTVPAIEPTGVAVPVVALDNTFRPQVVEVHVGDEVVWQNRGQNEHDVLSVEVEGWGVEATEFQPGDVYAHVFSVPGEYAYYCTIHGTDEVGMVGTVIVSA
jgi:plastocyanin